jgi:hypothetical protein
VNQALEKSKIKISQKNQNNEKIDIHRPKILSFLLRSLYNKK